MPRSAFPELIGKTLPALAQRIDVDDPRDRAAAARRSASSRACSSRSSRTATSCVVLPTLVYGDPPRARVDGRTLVHLERRAADPRRGRRAPARPPPARRAQPRARPPRRAHRPRSVRDAAGARHVAAHRREGRGGGEGRRRSTCSIDDRRRASSTSTLERRRPHAPRSARRCARGRPASTSSRSHGGGWGRVPMEWFDKHGERARRSARVARRRSQASRSTRCPISRGSAEDLDEPPPPELDRLRAAARRLRRHPARRRRPRASSASCARTSSAASTGSRSAATPASAACSPTTWVSARRSRRSPRCVRRQDARRRRRRACCSTGSPRSAKFRPDLKVATYRGRAPRARHRRRRRAHELSDPAQRHRRARRGRRGTRSSSTSRRRSRTPTARSRAPPTAQGDVAAHAVRYAGREPARRAVEPAPLHEPRPARRPRRLPGALGRADRPRRCTAPPRACASASGRSCCAG